MLVELPLVLTDPGCDAATHAPEVLGAAMAWGNGERWSQPAVMECGCSLWVGLAAADRVDWR
jgi:hypothetical protein